MAAGQWDYRNPVAKDRTEVPWQPGLGWGQEEAAQVPLGSMGPLPGRLFGLLYWWIGTTWYRLTTAASLLDVFVLTR